jgi:hypothetical protein
MVAGALFVGTIVGYCSGALVLLGGGSLVSSGLALSLGGAVATLATAALMALVKRPLTDMGPPSGEPDRADDRTALRPSDTQHAVPVG